MAFDSHVVVPYALEDLSFFRTSTSSPGHLSLAIALIPSEGTRKNGLACSIANLFVGQLTLSAEQAISELSKVFISIVEFSLSEPVEFASLKEASFCSVALKNVFVFVCELTLESLILLEGANKEASLSKG